MVSAATVLHWHRTTCRLVLFVCDSALAETMVATEMLKHRGSGDGGRKIGSSGRDDGGRNRGGGWKEQRRRLRWRQHWQNGRGRYQRRQTGTEAVAGADNNQQESGSDSGGNGYRGGHVDGDDGDSGSRDEYRISGYTYTKISAYLYSISICVFVNL